MSDVTVTGLVITNSQITGTTAVVRAYRDQSFIDSNGKAVIKGVPGSSDFFTFVPCTVAGNQISCPSFVLPSTTDSSRPSARVTLCLYDSNNRNQLATLYTWIVPPSPVSQTVQQLQLYTAGRPRPLGDAYMTRDQVVRYFNGSLFSGKATPNAAGIGKSSMNVADPVFVETTDPRNSDQRTPPDGSVTDAKVAGGISPAKIAGTAVVTSDPRLAGIGSYLFAALAALVSLVVGSIEFVTDQLRGLYYKTMQGMWVSLTGRANLADFYASGDSTQVITTGTNAAGVTINVSDGSTFRANQGIYVAGAGAAGVAYIGTVQSVSGNAVTVAPATSTSVAAGTLVQHDDGAAINAALAAVTNRYGGDVYAPNGYYRSNGPLDGTTNSIITFPQVRQSEAPMRTVRLLGESYGLYSITGQSPALTQGVVIAASSVNTGAGTQPQLKPTRRPPRTSCRRTSRPSTRSSKTSSLCSRPIPCSRDCNSTMRRPRR